MNCWLSDDIEGSKNVWCLIIHRLQCPYKRWSTWNMNMAHLWDANRMWSWYLVSWQQIQSTSQSYLYNLRSCQVLAWPTTLCIALGKFWLSCYFIQAVYSNCVSCLNQQGFSLIEECVYIYAASTRNLRPHWTVLCKSIFSDRITTRYKSDQWD